jgi:cytochrome bd ubiquinol oxidase subunit II
MQTAWLVIVGIFFTGYLVLEGRSIGIGLVLPFLGRTKEDRGALFAAIGPFFLANEVWIITALGMIVGGFPLFEGTLLAGFMPFFVTFVVGMALRGVGFQFRRRRESLFWRRFWETMITVASVLLAGSMAIVGSLLFQALPVSGEGVIHLSASTVLTPFTIACVLTGLVVFALQGTNFASTRIVGPTATKTIAFAKKLGPAALLGLIATFLTGIFSSDVRAAASQSALVIGLEVVAVVGIVLADLANWRDAPRAAFALSSVVLLDALLLVGFGRYPNLMVATGGGSANVTISEGAAEPGILSTLFWPVAILVPVLLGAQYLAWRLYRTRVDGTTPSYF